MSLASGTRVGPYDIVGPLGAGGMGEVYRARDRRLSRDVAVKLLPESFAADPERVTRFTREAHLLAAMNHPNIAHMYGVEEIERQSGPASAALIMELVEGTTLADRLAEGPLPSVEAIAIARQIAEALEYAHDHGVVHRDLKPANVKLRGDGVVKVLDFGLARALVPGTDVPDVSASPTELPLATEAGVILGTAAYMSPEQARGRAVDRRADIWSFGVVLFEMLAGRRVFDGTAATEIIAAVIRDDPPWDALPAATPPYLRALLERCLERDVRRRLRDIGEARIVLEQPPGIPADRRAIGSARRQTAKCVVAGNRRDCFVAGWIGTAAWLSRPAVVTPARPLQFAIPLASSVAGLNHQNLTLALAVSPDGQHVATVGPEGIWLWSATAGAARLVEDTVGAAAPFFSADGNHIGFFARRGAAAGCGRRRSGQLDHARALGQRGHMGRRRHDPLQHLDRSHFRPLAGVGPRRRAQAHRSGEGSGEPPRLSFLSPGRAPLSLHPRCQWRRSGQQAADLYWLDERSIGRLRGCRRFERLLLGQRSPRVRSRWITRRAALRRRAAAGQR